MPQEIQNGLAILWGTTKNGGRANLGIAAYASCLLDGAKAHHKFKLDTIEDENSSDASLIATNPHIEVDFTFTIAGTDRASSEAAGIFLGPLDTVALANFRLSNLNGDWIYMGEQSIDLSQKAAKMMVKLRRYTDSVQNTDLNKRVQEGSSGP